MAKVEQPNSGLIGGDPANKTKTRIYRCNKGEGAQYIAMPRNTPTEDGYFQHGALSSSEVWETIAITSSEKPISGSVQSRKNGEKRIRIQVPTVPQDIEYHPNYKVCWNHYMIAKDGDTAELPSDWETQTDKIIINSTYKDWRWLHKTEMAPEGWNAQTVPQKPKVDNYLVPSPQVIETWYYRKESNAEARLKTVGRIDTPSKTYSYTGEWFVIDSFVEYDGRMYYCESIYQLMFDVDEDIYS